MHNRTFAVSFLETKLIRPNPWQPRLAMDPLELAELADSIRTEGLLQPPIARPSPVHAGRYELAFGHRRFEAWKQAHPGQPMPVDVRELSNRQMAEHAATENAHRAQLNPVERARGLKRLMGEFGLTQTEAGKLYGLSSQGAVSNVIRLLDLPDAVLDLVANGRLSEKEARQLVPLGRAYPEGAAQIAAEYLADQDKEDTAYFRRDLEGVRDEWLRKHCRQLSEGEFPWNWSPSQLTLDDGQQPAAAPKCDGCQFKYGASKYVTYCLRTACHSAKRQAWTEQEAAKAAKHLKIPLVQPGEKVTVIYRGHWNEHDTAKALIARRPDHLRLVPALSDYPVRELGTRYAVLATTDKAAADKFKEALAIRDRRYTGGTSGLTREKAAQIEAKAEQDERHVQAMAAAAAPALAAALPDHDGLLEFMWRNWSGGGWEGAKWRKAKRAERKRMLMDAALDEGLFAGPAETRAELLAIAKQLKVKLPKGWDAEPKAPAPMVSPNGAKPPKGKK